jgi:phosphoserine aminotransferase
MARIFNFSAGPSTLPLPVLERVRDEMVDFQGSGLSLIEASHRGPDYLKVHETAGALMRELLGLPANYKVLFLQGGATLQFAMIPLNLLAGGKPCDFTVTGTWAKKAIADTKKIGKPRVIFDGSSENFMTLPDPTTLQVDPATTYLHVTSNETIGGVQWHGWPDAGNVPIVCDMSSDFLSRPIPVEKFGLIYAGAQKNLAPAGVTLVIIRDDLVKRTPSSLPTMLQYGVQVENKSLYNTPPVFAIYIMRLVMAWVLEQGGLAGVEQANIRKADKLYAEIDRSGFYRGHAQADSRSRMNITFRLPSEDLEKKFAKESTAEGLDGLKGHRSVGGLRASVYNAFPEAGIDALVQFMQEFERKNG